MTASDSAPTWRTALEYFLGEYLPRHRGLAERTRQSYATALRLLVEAAGAQRPLPHQLDAGTLLGFLSGLERERGNAPATRNLRLAAVRSFARAMALRDPDHREEYERLLHVPTKRAHRDAPDWLEIEDLARVFAQVDPRTPSGFRDLTLLRYAYNTGSRVSELCSVRVEGLALGDPPGVTIRGKGGRVRYCPLWATTAEMLRVYLRTERERPRPGHEEYLFLTRRRGRFGRSGMWKLVRQYLDAAARERPSLANKRLVPHSLRHTTAVHLLQAGVEPNVIKAWLGHADVATTSQYLDLDLDRKRDALERFGHLDRLGLLGTGASVTPLPANLVEWLEKL